MKTGQVILPRSRPVGRSFADCTLMPWQDLMGWMYRAVISVGEGRGPALLFFDVDFLGAFVK